MMAEDNCYIEPMTKIISFVNSKGGAGKTTLAFALATLWDKSGKHCLLIDCDPQANLQTFLAARENKGNMECIAPAIVKLAQRVKTEAASGNHDFILIDTPGRLAEIGPALTVADLVVVPVQPAGADFFSFKRIFDTCKSYSAHAMMVPNRIKTTGDVEACSEALKAMGVQEADIAPFISDRISHRRGTINGLSLVDLETNGKGLIEVRALAKRIEEMTNVTG